MSAPPEPQAWREMAEECDRDADAARTLRAWPLAARLPAYAAALRAAAEVKTLYHALVEQNAALAARVAAGERDAAEGLARRFHEAYERLAPAYGYQTRRESAKPWEEVPANNRALMTAVCAEILAALPPSAAPAAPDGGWCAQCLLNGRGRVRLNADMSCPMPDCVLYVPRGVQPRDGGPYSLFCHDCETWVPNTANHEMQREGAWSHSHRCSAPAAPEVRDA